jgi:hypothetical protein
MACFRYTTICRIYLCLAYFVSQGNNTSHSSSASHSSRNSQNYSGPKMTLEELRAVNRYAESTRSLSYLPQVRVF